MQARTIPGNFKGLGPTCSKLSDRAKIQIRGLFGEQQIFLSYLFLCDAAIL